MNLKKLIIAGSRHVSISPEDITGYLHDHGIVETIQEVVCGCANGADSAGELWAKHNGIPVKHFAADWSAHGKAAGPIRNKQMAEYGDELLLIWDGQSPGSKSMKRIMESAGKPVYEIKRGE